MATIAVTITAGAQSFSNSRPITGPHLNRMIAAYRAAYGQVLEGGVLRDRTDTEVLDSWWAGVVQGTVNYVKSYEQAVASKTASDAVTPISVT